MNSFYSTLYGKFADMQIEQGFSAKLVYPASCALPFLKTGKRISDCVAGIPPIHITNNRISYGLFVFDGNEFGQSAAIKLAMASTCLLSAKSIFKWLYQSYLKEWIASKTDVMKAGFTVNAIFDSLAKQTIHHVEGQDFYNDVIGTADVISAALLVRNPKDFSELIQTAVVSDILGISFPAPTAISKIAKSFLSELNALVFDGAKLIDTLRDHISLEGNSIADISKSEIEWDELAACADVLYAAITKVT